MRRRSTLIMLGLSAALLPGVRHAAAQPISEAHAPWWQRAREARAGDYLLKTDLPAPQARALAEHLVRMHREYGQRLASLPPRVPATLNVYVFARRVEYDTVLRHKFGVNAAGTAGMFFVTELGSGLAFWTEGLPTTRVHHILQHEGFHQFAWSRFGNDLPVWVNEGLAEFFGEAVFVGNRLVIGQSTANVIDSVKAAIENGTSIPFPDMLRRGDRRWQEALATDQAALQYNQAWSMVHFLVYGDSGRYVTVFESYLHLLNKAMLPDEAFTRSFGSDVDAFEKRWKAYAMASGPSAFRTALDRIEFLADGALELSREGVQPVTLDELQTQLVRIDFRRRSIRHGLDTVDIASDPERYLIPRDERVVEQPVFEVEPLNVHRLSRREQFWEKTQPTPPTIRTQHLRPYELKVIWKRDRKTGALLGYEIELKPAG